MTHREVVAGLSDEHLSNLAGSVEAGLLGYAMSSQNCAAACAMNAASETDYHVRFKGYEARTQSVRILEHAYCGWHNYMDNQLHAPELYQLVIQEQALRVKHVAPREELVGV